MQKLEAVGTLHLQSRSREPLSMLVHTLIPALLEAEAGRFL